MPTRKPTMANRRGPGKIQRNNLLIQITPFALFAPYMLTIYIGTLKLTPAKLLTVLLVIPAITRLVSGVLAHRRTFVAADFLAIALTVWLSFSPILVSGSDVVVSAASQALEFFGSYIIGRAYFYGSEALASFGKALAIVAIVITTIGLFDTATHHYVVSEILTPIFYSPGEPLDSSNPQLNRSLLGIQLIRAASTFDHPILFGMFCAISVCILSYMRPSRFRFLGIIFCIFGCVVALSSAAILALIIVGAVRFYDIVLKRAAWRWKAMLALVTTFLGIIWISTNGPVTWIIRNLTFDPQTGYFRILVWDAAMPYINANFWSGKGSQLTGNLFVDGSVDSLWLGMALTYGIPAVVLLVLIGFTVIFPCRFSARVRLREADIDALCTAFSLAIIVFGLMGLTVYYWNGVWLYAALCLGIRASLKEYCCMSKSEKTVAGNMVVRTSSRIHGYACPCSLPSGALLNRA